MTGDKYSAYNVANTAYLPCGCFLVWFFSRALPAWSFSSHTRHLSHISVAVQLSIHILAFGKNVKNSSEKWFRFNFLLGPSISRIWAVWQKRTFRCDSFPWITIFRWNYQMPLNIVSYVSFVDKWLNNRLKAAENKYLRRMREGVR